MTEKELIARQEESGNRTFFLLKVGMFYHAYACGAFALARLMGYRVKRKSRKGGAEVLVAGFPAESLAKVRLKMEQAGISLQRVQAEDENLYSFSGADGTPDSALIDAAPEKAAAGASSASAASAGAASAAAPCCANAAGCELRRLKELILSFQLGSSTPLEAMNFVSSLQKLWP